MSRIHKPEEWAAERIIELIKEGHLPPWAKSWSVASETSPRNLLYPKQFYKGLNYWLLMMVAEIYGSPFFITPKQLFKIGGKKKDDTQKTWPVYFFSTREYEDKETGEKKKSFLCKGYKVYNIKQTEGIPEDKIPVISEPETFDHAPIGACDQIVKGYLTGPEVVHHSGEAFYRPTEDKIYMPDMNRFKTAEEYYCARFHEMGHSTGHKSRLNRDAIQQVNFASHAYSEEELVAEFCAAMLCGKAGIAMSTIENSAAYIKGWASKLKPEILVLGSRAARKAFECIVGEAAAEEVAA